MYAKLAPATILIFIGIHLTCPLGGHTFAADLPSLPPTADELDAWSPVGRPLQYEGMDLYELINGGAEVYHEYGFRKVMAQEYSDQKQRYIALEVYEMENAAAAFGIYSFKTGPGGRTIPLGTEAILADHYLNIWKDRYLLTLSGSHSDDVTRQGLVEIGKAVTDKITQAGPRPELTLLLPDQPESPGKIWYLAGNLALANLAPIAGLVPLGFTEGVAAEYEEGLRLFLLSYGNPEQADDDYFSAVERMSAKGLSRLDQAKVLTPQGTRFKGGKGGTILLESAQGFILVLIGEEKTDFESIRGFLLDRLATYGDR